MSKTEKVLGDFGLKIFKGFVLEKDITPSPEMFNDIASILIVVRHQLGDMLCSVPMLKSVRTRFPDAEITLLTKRSTGYKEIFEENDPPADNVFLYEYGFENFVNTVKLIRDKNPQLAIVPSSVTFSATNHMLAYYSRSQYRAGVRSKDFEPNKIGYTLNIKNDFLWDSKKIHQIERNLDVIRQLGISAEWNTINLTVNDKKKKFAEEFFRENFPDVSKKVIGFHPGAAKEGNIWPQEKFAELIDQLHKRTGAYFYISEGPADTKIISSLEMIIKQKFPHVMYAKYCGELMNNAAIISKTNLFVSNDTGIMHLASGFDIPVIGLFGPTKAYEWGPVGKNKASIQATGGSIKNIEITDVFETCMTYLSV